MAVGGAAVPRRKQFHPTDPREGAAAAVVVVDGVAVGHRRRVIEPAIAKRMPRADGYLLGRCHPLMGRPGSDEVTSELSLAVASDQRIVIKSTSNRVLDAWEGGSE